MFDKMNEQMQASIKPVTELATLNMKTLQELAEQQNALFTTLLNDSVSFMESASKEKDVMGLVDIQKNYVEGFQEKVTEAAKDAYGVISSAQQQAGEMMKGLSEEMTSKFTAAAK